MGLALLANLAAYDFGYLQAGRLVERTANTLGTMAGLERHRGHFYNWYDTQTLQPLSPRYISTVDSGNLAGHLLTLRAGLLALAGERIVPSRLFAGMSDTFGILADAADGVVGGPMAAFRQALASAVATPPNTLAAARSALARLATVADQLVGQVAASIEIRADTVPDSEANEWAQALARQCHEALDELTLFADGAPIATMPTLRELARAGSAQRRKPAGGHRRPGKAMRRTGRPGV